MHFDDIVVRQNDDVVAFTQRKELEMNIRLSSFRF